MLDVPPCADGAMSGLLCEVEMRRAQHRTSNFPCLSGCLTKSEVILSQRREGEGEAARSRRIPWNGRRTSGRLRCFHGMLRLRSVSAFARDGTPLSMTSILKAITSHPRWPGKLSSNRISMQHSTSNQGSPQASVMLCLSANIRPCHVRSSSRREFPACARRLHS